MESNNMKFPDDPSVTLTIRLIMQGKVSHLHTIIDFLLPFIVPCVIHVPSNENECERRFILQSFWIHQAVNLSSLWSFMRNLFFVFYFAIHVNPAINRSWIVEAAVDCKGKWGRAAALDRFLVDLLRVEASVVRFYLLLATKPFNLHSFTIKQAVVWLFFSCHELFHSCWLFHYFHAICNDYLMNVKSQCHPNQAVILRFRRNLLKVSLKSLKQSTEWKTVCWWIPIMESIFLLFYLSSPSRFAFLFFLSLSLCLFLFWLWCSCLYVRWLTFSCQS